MLDKKYEVTYLSTNQYLFWAQFLAFPLRLTALPFPACLPTPPPLYVSQKDHLAGGSAGT